MAGFFKKLLTKFSRGTRIDWDELEADLVTADIGIRRAMNIVDQLRESRGLDAENLVESTREVIRQAFPATPPSLPAPPEGYPLVILVVGVNGTGKTTSAAKLGHLLQKQGGKVLLAAADTFRAAAVEQLGIWAERTGSGFHSKGQNADPAAVAWEAMDIAIRDQYDILFIDTAGRLHTKSNLMDELHKIREVIARKHPGAPHRSILIVDATTGQNALQQTKIFKEAAGIDELILTKLDGTAKGGVAVAVSMQYGIPITYVGLGEKMEDLRPFNGDDFAKALLEQ